MEHIAIIHLNYRNNPLLFKAATQDNCDPRARPRQQNGQREDGAKAHNIWIVLPGRSPTIDKSILALSENLFLTFERAPGTWIGLGCPRPARAV